MNLYSYKFNLRAASCLVFGLLLFPSITFAVPPNGGEILREQHQNQQPSQKSPTIEYKPQENSGAQEAQGPKVNVTAFSFIGDVHPLKGRSLQKIVKGYIGQTLSFGQLQDVADQVSQYLRNKGYAFARSYLAAQEIKDGVVEITILLGRIEKEGISINGDKLRVKEDRVHQTLADALARDPYLKMQNLERGLLLLNSLPGVAARASLDAGQSFDTTHITTTVSEDHLVSANVSTDNFGNRYTGTERYNSQVNLNDPFGRGDQITIQTTSAEGLDIERAGYTVPVGYNGLRVGANYTDLIYRIGKEFSSLNSHGSAQMGNANVSYPFILTQKVNLNGSFDYDYKAFRDMSQQSTTDNKRVNLETLALNGNSKDDFYGGAFNYYNMALGLGNLNLARVPSYLSSDASGPRAEGNYIKFDYNVARLQHLLGNWSFFSAFNAQASNKNLDSSEKFIIGGPTGVRAYPTGEASGDEGWVTNLELRYDVPWKTRLGNWQIVEFYDTGHVTLYKNTWSGWNSGSNLPNHYGLSGAGVGLNLLKNKDYALRISYAWPVGRNPGISTSGLESDGKRKSGRLWLQFEVYF